MGEITAKLFDAASMFWLALDDRERRLILLGLATVAALAFYAPLETRRREQEKNALADEVARRLIEAGYARD